MKTRIEVDEMGRYILILPEDVIEDYMICEGDSVLLEDAEGILHVHF